MGECAQRKVVVTEEAAIVIQEEVKFELYETFVCFCVKWWPFQFFAISAKKIVGAKTTPSVGFEPTTARLTAERAASCANQDALM